MYLTAQIPMRGFTPGQKIDVKIDINNESIKNVKFSIQLIQVDYFLHYCIESQIYQLNLNYYSNLYSFQLHISVQKKLNRHWCVKINALAYAKPTIPKRLMHR